MKQYFVQTINSDGEVSLSVNTENQIIEMFGFRDCTGCEYEVYDGGEFGKIVKLDHLPALSAPFNYHQFVNSETAELAFDGFSAEH
jgi:hypothetical protein